MRRVTTGMAVLAIGFATIAGAPAAALGSPRPKIEWARIDVPDGQDSARLAKVLKQALSQAAKKANFGKAAKTVTLSARVTEFTSEQHGDVLQVSCTVMGRVARGAGARSRISYGG